MLHTFHRRDGKCECRTVCFISLFLSRLAEKELPFPSILSVRQQFLCMKETRCQANLKDYARSAHKHEQVDTCVRDCVEGKNCCIRKFSFCYSHCQGLFFFQGHHHPTYATVNTPILFHSNGGRSRIYSCACLVGGLVSATRT